LIWFWPAGKFCKGKLYESYDQALGTSVKMVDSKGKLVFPGFIDEADLPALYKGSLAFVNVSKSEGFNLPALEALCSGTPVIASDIAIHHEVLGDFGHFVSPDDSVFLAQMLRKFISDETFARTCPHRNFRLRVRLYLEQ
jgi:glycosyltransferase involved in cell wall biosynthesis